MADLRERFNDPEEAMRVAIERHLGTVWTALPVQVSSDSDGHTCTLKSAVKGWQQAADGTLTPVEISELGDVPVTYSQGGGFVITHPVKAGDEGIAIFASRCIDGWWQQGGIQAEPYRRRHHLSDAMYLPGIRSQPRRLGGGAAGRSTQPASTSSVQIRTEAGDCFIELTADSVNITTTLNVTITCKDATITASDKITLASPQVVITGNLEVDGEITGKSGGSSSVAISTHRHTGVSSGSSTSGPPQAGSLE